MFPAGSLTFASARPRPQKSGRSPSGRLDVLIEVMKLPSGQLDSASGLARPPRWTTCTAWMKGGRILDGDVGVQSFTAVDQAIALDDVQLLAVRRR